MVKSLTLEIDQFKKTTEWCTIGIRIRNTTEISLFNRQLDRLDYTTLGDLVKDLIDEKITRLTDDQQIDIMKTNLQSSEWTNYWSFWQALRSLQTKLIKYLELYNLIRTRIK